MRRTFRLLPCGVLVLLGAACSAADVEGTPLGGEPTDPSTTGQAAGPAACIPGSPAGPALGPTDPATFPKCSTCTGGSARCVPKGRLPASFATQLAECSEGGPGLCVPDTFLKSGGAAPPSCKSIAGKEGVCLSLCVPQVEQNEALLPKEGCADDERCAPCLNPLKNNEPTGACDLGKAPACANGSGANASAVPSAPAKCPHEGPPIIDPASFPACGDGAHCAPAAAVPAPLQAQLKVCATGLCVPDKLIAAGGNYIPATCTSLGGAEGRCTNVNIPQVEAQKERLPADTCDASERCVPCFDPVTGADTGACKVSCDPGPKQPMTLFKACCDLEDAPSGRGKCVPEALVSERQKKNLGTDGKTCVKGTERCVPNEMLDPKYVPAACTATNLLVGNYTGVCLSNCLSFGIQGLAISRGSCATGNRCAPCSNPLTGRPTNAPGCPGT